LACGAPAAGHYIFINSGNSALIPAPESPCSARPSLAICEDVLYGKHCRQKLRKSARICEKWLFKRTYAATSRLPLQLGNNIGAMINRFLMCLLKK
jgi:hypothetical protein